jgi:hypothetical protein
MTELRASFRSSAHAPKRDSYFQLNLAVQQEMCLKIDLTFLHLVTRFFCYEACVETNQNKAVRQDRVRVVGNVLLSVLPEVGVGSRGTQPNSAGVGQMITAFRTTNFLAWSENVTALQRSICSARNILHVCWRNCLKWLRFVIVLFPSKGKSFIGMKWLKWLVNDSDGMLEALSSYRVILYDRVMKDTNIACSVGLGCNGKWLEWDREHKIIF